MPQYLVANYLPDNFDPSTVTEAMMEEIHALNREMIAAGVRKFACGISPAANAKTLRKQPDGKVLVTDGPYPRPRSTWADFGYWNAPISTRRWHGRRRLQSPAMWPARCATFILPGSGTRTRRKEVNSRGYATRKICKSRVDSPPPWSTSKWSRTAHATSQLSEASAVRGLI